MDNRAIKPVFFHFMSDMGARARNRNRGTILLHFPYRAHKRVCPCSIDEGNSGEIEHEMAWRITNPVKHSANLGRCAKKEWA